MVPRFRFAPSPTGTPHIGNLHTALFSWALARALGGDFILRIEDTDSDRNAPEATKQMLAALTWLGLDWDEGPDVGGNYGPYIQSHRIDAHKRVMAQLVDEGLAYYGDDPQRPGNPDEQPLRLRMPRNERIILNDALRGPIIFENMPSDDPIIVRANGRPLYHLAAMVDDHEMDITHVVRGEEWISSSPIHIQLYRVMGWEEPVWIHLPLILDRNGRKLSKRDDQGGYLITDFQQAGYLPRALFNYLLLLGWAPDGEQELVDKWTVRKQLRVERLSPSPAVFDWDKLRWMNRQYMQKLSNNSLAEEIRPFLEGAYGQELDDQWLVQLTAVIRDELHTLADAVEAADWALADTVQYCEDGREALATDPTHPVLVRLVAELAAVVLLDQATAKRILNGLRTGFGQSHGWSAPQIFHPIRAALTGTTGGPPLHKIMGLLGKDRCLQRLAAALK